MEFLGGYQVVSFIGVTVAGMVLFWVRAVCPQILGIIEIASAYWLVYLAVQVSGGFALGKSAFGGPDGLGPLQYAVSWTAFIGAVFVFARGLANLFPQLPIRKPAKGQPGNRSVSASSLQDK
jgi:hypothetical protein